MSFPLMPIDSPAESSGSVVLTSGTFIVPLGITTLSVTLRGAGGGGGGGQVSNPYRGGNGGRGALVVQTALAVTPGETLTISGGVAGTGGSFRNAVGGEIVGDATAGTTLSLLRGGTTLMSAGGGGLGWPAFVSPLYGYSSGRNGTSSGTGTGGTVTTGGGSAGGAGRISPNGGDNGVGGSVTISW